MQQETSTASELKSMLITLKFPKPPDNIQPAQLFVKVEQRVCVQIALNSESKSLFYQFVPNSFWF